MKVKVPRQGKTLEQAFPASYKGEEEPSKNILPGDW